MRKSKGILIAFEGLSCSGKSSCLELLLKKIEFSGKKAVVVKWNSVRVIRWATIWLNRHGLLTPKKYSILQWHSFLITYYTKVYPNLFRGKIVLADRYIYTAITRDGMNGVSTDFTARLYRYSKKPDVILFLATPPEVCADRVKEEGRKIFHLCDSINKTVKPENWVLDYLSGLYERYIDLFSEGNILRENRLIKIGEKSNAPNLEDFPQITDWMPASFIDEMDEDCKQYMRKYG
jgi:dTMP kinase